MLFLSVYVILHTDICTIVNLYPMYKIAQRSMKIFYLNILLLYKNNKHCGEPELCSLLTPFQNRSTIVYISGLNFNVAQYPCVLVVEQSCELMLPMFALLYKVFVLPNHQIKEKKEMKTRLCFCSRN